MVKEFKDLMRDDTTLQDFTLALAKQKGLKVDDKVDNQTPDLEPIVDHDRWIVLCPFCSGAEAADSKDLRFFCLSCGNAKVDGQWLKVKFPSHRTEIEAVLAQEEDPEKRNWQRAK